SEGCGDRWVDSVQRGNSQTGQDVQVPVPIGVDEPRPLPCHEGHRGAGIGPHDHPRLPLEQARHGVTIVPIPSEVKISRRRACWTRPSRMCAWETPPSRASATERSVGSIPPSIRSSSRRRSERSIFEMRLEGSSTFSYTPSTSVRYTSFCACRALARTPAAVSALTL